jgi:SAM-dependent methyltransferase
MDGSTYASRSKLDVMLGPGIWAAIQGARVVDFGSGEGAESIELALRGAGNVVGVEIQERFRQLATSHARAAGVQDRVQFSASSPQQADVVVSLDSFEHFSDPDAILTQISGILAPGGRLFAAFGPTWYHPRGGHLFSVFPWAHLIFSESALIRWRSGFKSDGATRFGEVAGGLNQMTIGRFEKMVRRSPLEVEALECVPIRKFKSVAARWNREVTTSIVRACLRMPAHS